MGLLFRDLFIGDFERIIFRSLRVVLKRGDTAVEHFRVVVISKVFKLLRCIKNKNFSVFCILCVSSSSQIRGIGHNLLRQLQKELFHHLRFYYAPKIEVLHFSQFSTFLTILKIIKLILICFVSSQKNYFCIYIFTIYQKLKLHIFLIFIHF